MSLAVRLMKEQHLLSWIFYAGMICDFQMHPILTKLTANYTDCKLNKYPYSVGLPLLSMVFCCVFSFTLNKFKKYFKYFQVNDIVASVDSEKTFKD